jgi:hypothetical protein
MARTARWIAGVGAGASAFLGLGYVARTWYGYGRAREDETPDPLLDRFMPAYDVRERHQARVAAPAADTWAASLALDLQRSRIARAIFRGRELLMGGDRVRNEARGTLLSTTLALGWRVLAEDPGHEIVVGAVTRPWEANPRFEGLPAEEFVAFAEPGYVKIAWMLGAEPRGTGESTALTETRVATTDAVGRARFRRYWTAMSPGILLIRRVGLRLVKTEAESAARARTRALPL